MEKKLMRTVNENGGLWSKNTILLSKQKNMQIMNYWWDKCHLYCPFKGSCLV